MIDPERVMACMHAALPTVPPADPATDPNTLVVEGITTTVGFDRARLEAQRAEIRSMLDQLPNAFHQRMGGGWSFLNLCLDNAGNQWTGEHRVMEYLCLMAIGLVMMKWCLPREMWSALPGEMPYVMIVE